MCQNSFGLMSLRYGTAGARYQTTSVSWSRMTSRRVGTNGAGRICGLDDWLDNSEQVNKPLSLVPLCFFVAYRQRTGVPAYRKSCHCVVRLQMIVIIITIIAAAEARRMAVARSGRPEALHLRSLLYAISAASVQAEAEAIHAALPRPAAGPASSCDGVGRAGGGGGA